MHKWFHYLFAESLLIITALILLYNVIFLTNSDRIRYTNPTTYKIHRLKKHHEKKEVTEHYVRNEDGNIRMVPRHSSCLGSTLYAVKNGAGLGNVMFELLGFHAIAARVNRVAVVYESYMRDKIKDVSVLFPNVPSFFYDADESECDSPQDVQVAYHGCCRFDENIIKKLRSRKHVRAVTIKLFYLQSFKFFDNLPRDALLRFFAPAEHVQEGVHQLFETKAGMRDLNVCVHVRRGDFTNSSETLPSNEDFAKSALDYILAEAYEEDSRKPFLFIMSDDPEWARSTFKNYSRLYVALTHKRSIPPGTEWEFSRQFCDRVLLTASVSTYGYWIGYLSRGQRVYYNRHYTHDGENGIAKQLIPTDFWPSHWIPVNNCELNGSFEAIC